MKIAIACSWLNQYGGAERVLEVVHEMYPEAPVFTTIYWPQALPEAYRGWDIRTSFLDRWPLVKQHHQWFLPFYPSAVESLDLAGYDVVLSITSAFAHGLITPPETRHICYCLTPARFLWDYETYVEREQLGRAARLVLPGLIKALRAWDQRVSTRVDDFLAISKAVQSRIAQHYGRDSQIIYPPVNVPDVPLPRERGGYYLSLGRLIPYKRVDLVVRAFNQLGLPLHIVGDGRDRAALEAIAKPNIRFLGRLSDAEVREQYAGCRAFVFPGEEDFGITPVEAQAAGRPVIAYAGGGALDTVLDGETGILFRDKTPEALAEAVMRCEAA
ncbi:MAG: glycosyltransferase family 4 protein, partial [Chloroflexi bacterium]|nr:glycosyltransferase family 4 protein [Chloroflexota bacterium]